MARSNAGTMQSGEKSGLVDGGGAGWRRSRRGDRSKKKKKKGGDRETTVLLLGNGPFKLDEKF